MADQSTRTFAQALLPARNGAAFANPGDKPCGKGVCAWGRRTSPARAADEDAGCTSFDDLLGA